jgi:signal transduction histidine kinase
MVAELRRVTNTVGSLLRLAKPNPPRRSDVNLVQSVRDVATIFLPRFRRAGVSLRVECSQDIPVLRLDASLIAQLLINLLTNSLQATTRGGSVDIFVAPFPRRDGVALAVSDTGRGIAPEHAERVFDPFFTTKEEGTGLGLAICRQIVEQHGGTISIESELGKGTRVIVLFPDTEERHVAVAAG